MAISQKPLDATFLTEKYSDRSKQWTEENLWTPCISNFFMECKPDLPVWQCTLRRGENIPWYEKRESNPLLNARGEIYMESRYSFLDVISKSFHLNLKNDADRLIGECDIAGFMPDIVLINPAQKKVSIIEIKPYYHSTLTPAQKREYPACVNWLRKHNISSEYLILAPLAWLDRCHRQIESIQESIPNGFGLIFLDDVFAQMHTHGFKDPRISERWIEYADKGSEFPYFGYK